MTGTTESSRGLFTNMAYAGVSAASAGLLLILFVVAGRFLGEIEFGKFSFALMLGTIFETLMDFGFHQVIIREVARDRARARDLLGHTLGIKLLWAGGGLAALLVTATVLRSEWDVRVACYVIGGSLVMRSYMLTIRGVLQGLERFGWDSFVVLADRVILVVCGSAALVAGTGLRGLTIAFVIARALALVVAGSLTRVQLGGIGMQFDRDVWRELHRSALPLGFFLVVLNLYSYIDSVMLGVMRGDAETGVYAAAYKTYEGFSYAPSIIAAVLTPRLSRLFRRTGRPVSDAGIRVCGAADHSPVWPAIRAGGCAVPDSVRGAPIRLRDLDPACDRHFGRQSALAGEGGGHRARRQRRDQFLGDSSFRRVGFRAGDGDRRGRQHDGPHRGVDLGSLVLGPSCFVRPKS